MGKITWKLWERRKFPTCACEFKKVLNPPLFLPSTSPHLMNFRNIDRVFKFNRVKDRHPELTEQKVFVLFCVWYISKREHVTFPKITKMMKRAKKGIQNVVITELVRDGYLYRTQVKKNALYSLSPLGLYYLDSLERDLRSLRNDR